MKGWHNLSVKEKALISERNLKGKFAIRLYRCHYCKFIVSERDREGHMGRCTESAAKGASYARGAPPDEQHFEEVDMHGRSVTPAIVIKVREPQPPKEQEMPKAPLFVLSWTESHEETLTWPEVVARHNELTKRGVTTQCAPQVAAAPAEKKPDAPAPVKRRKRRKPLPDQAKATNGATAPEKAAE